MLAVLLSNDVHAVITGAPTIKVTRTPNPMVAGQAQTVVWSTTNATLIEYSCTASGTGFVDSGTLPANGRASGTADPAWVGYPSTCVWIAENNNDQSTTFNETLVTVAPPLPPPSCPTIYPAAGSTTAVSGSFRIFATDTQNVQSMRFATWGDPGGQDDLAWYAGVNAGGGTWFADVNLANHKSGNPEFGTFHTDVYASNSSTVDKYCGSVTWSRTQALTPPNLSLTSCSSNSPVAAPNAATMSCTLSNTGQTAASSISYSTPPGTSIQGPTGVCQPNSVCGIVRVSSGNNVGDYNGTLTASPNQGQPASVNVSLAVRNLPTFSVNRIPSPMVAGQVHHIEWQSSNAANISYTCSAPGAGFKGAGTLPVPGGSSSPAIADPAWVGNDSTCVYTITSNEGLSTTYTEVLKTVNNDVAPTISVNRVPVPMKANRNQTMTWSTTNAISLNYACTSTGTGYTGTGSLPVSGGSTGAVLADPAWIGYDSTCVYTATSASGKTTTYTEILKTVAPDLIGSAPTASLSATPTNVRVGSNGTASITLNGSGTDKDGQVIRLDILQDSGSGFNSIPVKTVSGNTATTSVSYNTDLKPGSYRFKLRSSDNDGNYTESTVVTVNVSDNSLLGQVSGIRTDANNKPILYGWVCQDTIPQSLPYDVFVNAPPNLGGTLILSGVANVASEFDNANVQAQCHTSGTPHHFTVDLSNYSAAIGQYVGAPIYVRATAAIGGATAILPCADNNCTMPGSLRVGLTTPADGDRYSAPANVFMRAKASGDNAPFDEIAFSVDGAWIAGTADTAANTYFASQGGLVARSTPYIVIAKVRKGNTTVYSAPNRIYVDGTSAATLSLTSPANGASFMTGATVSLSATPSGAVGSVKFYANDVLIANASNTNGVWSASWIAGAAGSINLTAKAFDANGVLLVQSANVAITISGSGSGTDSSAPIPVNITPPHLNNSDAGTLPGELGVSNNGAATYSMPIQVPPGTAGLQPALSLNYNSQGTNGLLGLGWTLSGLSSIHRCGKTIAQDGVNGRIGFDHGDRLCLDGQRLVLVNLPLTDDNYWADNAEYRTEVESFSRITAQGSGNQRSFRVETKDGRVMSFGNTADSFVQAIIGYVNSGTTAPQPQKKNGAQSWALGEVRDRSGNFIRFNYQQDAGTGEHHPTYIRYGANGMPSHAAVQLIYEAMPDAWKRYLDETRNDLRSRVTNIKTYTGSNLDGDVVANGTIARDYTLNYEQSPTSGRSLLNSVAACARNPQTSSMECLPATTFAWGKPDPGKTLGFESKGTWAGAPSMNAPRTVNGYSDVVINDKAFVFSDFENHGYTDILEKAPAMQVGPNPIEPQTQYRYFHNNGKSFTPYTYKLSTGEAFVVLDTGDFNGDGVLDILVTPGNSQNSGLLPQKICLSPLGKPDALGSPGSTIVFNCESGWPPTRLGVPYVVDVLGDGRSAVYSSNNSGVVTVCIKGMCQQDPSPPNSLAMLSADDGSPEYAQSQYVKLSQVVDFTGIGKPYDVRWTTPNFQQYIQDGTESIYNPHYENLQPTIVLNNFNPPGATTNLGAMANYTYKAYPQPPKNSPYLPYQFSKYSQMGSLVADFNGSGYNALVFGFAEMATPMSSGLSEYSRAELTVCLSTGRALDCGVRRKYSGSQYVAVRAVGNFVGDGQSTILVDKLNPVPGSRPMPSGDLQMCSLTGDDTTNGNGIDDDHIVCTPWNGFKVPTVASGNPLDRLYFLDLLGTGRTQIVQYHAGHSDGLGGWSETGWEVFAPVDVAVSGQALDRIYQVNNGVGVVSTVTYADGVPTGVVTQPRNSNLSYPLHTVPSTGKFVSKLTVSNGSSNGSPIVQQSSYHYEDAATDLSGRGSLGFAKVVKTDWLTKQVTTTTYNQTWPFVGMPLTVTINSSKSVALSSSSSTQKQIILTQDNGQKTYFPYVEHSDVVTNDLDGSYLNTTTTDNQYTDGWGNLNQQDVKVDGDGGSFLSSTVTSYLNNKPTWVIGKPQSLTITRIDPVNGAITRQHNYDYDQSTSLLKSETQMLGNRLLQVVTTYDRTGNNLGLVNKKSETWYNPIATPAHAAPGQQTRIVSDITYDSNGRFATTVKDAFGFATIYEYDPSTGAKTKAMDPNQLSTTWEVNGFGRVTREVRPDGNDTRSYQKQCDSTCPVGAVVTSIRDDLHNGARINVPQVSYQDNAGHLLRSLSWGFDGRQIVQDRSYDTLGRLRNVEQPHFVGEAVYLERTLDYDELNRITMTTSYDVNGAPLLTKNEYKGNDVIHTNAKNDHLTDHHNAIGKVVSVTDAKNGVTNFSYDAFGNLVRTTDPEGNVITVQYDALGRKTDLKDPDLGWIHYDVDPLGRIWKQTSPNQRQLQTASITDYDNLNRMTARFEPDLESHWTFDTSSNTSMAIGKLVEAYTGTPAQKDYRRLHYYDNLGRNNKTVQSLMDGSYTSAQTYDDWNRISQQQYQRNNDSIKAYDYRYNSQGYLVKIMRGPLALMEIKTQDAANRLIETGFGNGLKQVRQYSPYTGRLSDGQLSTNANIVHLHEVYSYDNLGSVVQRSQYWDGQGFQEGFEYDELNRLRSSTVMGQAPQLFTYSPSGSLLNKGNVNNGATYNYPAQGSTSVQPHAVTSITGIGSYAYDFNGNMIIGPGRSMSWTSFDMPRTLSKGGITDSFAYGPEHQRTRQTKFDGNVIYAGAQEVNIKNGQTTVKTYWPNGLGVEIDKPGSSSELNWTHLDRLGSIVGITDAAGNLKEKLAYDAWGKRRTFDSSMVNGSVTPDSLDGQTDNRGYTGHEMLDDLDLVHMNGRVYDPLVAKFLSGDPLLQDPMNGQNYNRYSYVLNNPTNQTDPTGFACNMDSGLTSCGGGDWRKSGSPLTNAEIAMANRLFGKSPSTLSDQEPSTRQSKSPDGVDKSNGKNRARNNAGTSGSQAGTNGGSQSADGIPQVVIPGKRYSGPDWSSSFPTSRSLDDLNSDFAPKAKAFIGALENAGAQVRINATLRPRQRAYLMHYSSAIARGEIKAADVPAMDGVNINWVHDTDKESVSAAAALAKSFDIVYPPALISRHSEGGAVDMTITGIVGSSMVNGKGNTVEINNKNDLNDAAASYGVYKLKSDPPHWSDNGH